MDSRFHGNDGGEHGNDEGACVCDNDEGVGREIDEEPRNYAGR